MAVLDTAQVYVGALDTSALSRFLTHDVRPYSAGSWMYVARNGSTLGAWSCSIKRAIGPVPPQAFPTALALTASVITQPATNAADLSATDAVVLTNDVVGVGIVDIWFCGKA